MEFVTINKGDTSLLTEHFRHSEFYSTSRDAPASHPFPQTLVEAAEILRVYLEVPMRITSTLRTPVHELGICQAYNLNPVLAKTSQHVKGRAMDIQPARDQARVMAELHQDFLNQGPHFRRLRALGVTGFGIYDTFIHLDVRTEPGKQSDRWGRFAFWDNRTVSTKKSTPSPMRTPRPASVA